jgi:hypothetical protein
MLLPTCGLAHMVQLLVFQQLRSWIRTLVMRVAVQILAAGLASLGISRVAWGMRGN